jgi:tRNA(fMet)-specific endonuclease VapC
VARYLLDTNVMIRATLGEPVILERLSALAISDVAMSAITFAELAAGAAEFADASGALRDRLSLVAENVDVLPFDADAAQAYGRLMTALKAKRSRALDRMIAAHALSAGMKLVTTNVDDFDDVPGLTLEVWAA